MQSRRSSEFRRSFMSALAAVLTAAVPSLVSSPALAEKAPDKTPEGAAADASGKGTKDAKAEPKRAAKAAPAKKTHTPAKPEAVAKPEATPKPDGAKGGKEAKATPAAAPKGKKAKKTASRSAAKGKKTAKKADPPRRRCLGTPLAIDRGGLEAQSLALLDCHDQPTEAAQLALSVLARPWGAQKPEHIASPASHPGKAVLPNGRPAGELAPGVRMLDKGLLTRLDAVARHFQGKPISLVSGYRPQSRGSLHQSARALDLRVAGVANEELVAFCKTLPDTGCGYYPNSSFVHLDVRNRGTGGASWIDASGPGEAPHYVRTWPTPAGEADTAVLGSDTEPHDGSADPWATDPADEHAGAPAESAFDKL
jgi:hypothetical protein